MLPANRTAIVYVPSQYRPSDLEASLEIIRQYPLGTVISSVAQEPFVSYIPFTIFQTEPTLVLTAHLARANPHWKHFEEAPVLVLFRGPDGYISPRFYQDCSKNVPTWNYVAVHCTGRLTIAPPQDTYEILDALVNRMEASAKHSWRIEDMDEAYFEKLQEAIVPFSFSVSKVEAKFKLSQRGSDGDIAGLIAGLRESGSERDGLLADAMERMQRKNSPGA